MIFSRTPFTYSSMFLWMFMIGVIEPMRAILLPEIRLDLNLTYTAVGTLIFVSYWGFFWGCALSGFLADRYGDKLLIGIGGATIVLSTLVVTQVQNYLLLVIVMTAFRCGVGMLDIAITAHGGRIFKKNAAIKMNLLHLCFGVGGTLAPLYVSFLFVRDYGWQSAYFWLAVPAVVALILLGIAPFRVTRIPTANWKTDLKTLMKEKRVFLLMILMGCAIIFEGSLLEWSKNYLIEIRNFNTERANFYLTAFYGGLVIGRIFNGYVAEKLKYLNTYLLYAIIIIVLFILFLSSAQFNILFLVLGWFIAPFFPIVMVLASKYWPHLTGGTMGIILAAGGLVQSGFSFSIGVAHDLFGVQTGYAMLVLGMLMAIPVIILLKREERKAGN